MNRFLLTITLVVLLAVALIPGLAAAAGPRAFPFEFVGTVANCGSDGSRLVSGQWVGGIGLPDNTALDNNGTSAAGRHDIRNGLLLSKNGLTSNCSASGATIAGAFDHAIVAGSQFGFDYNNGTHCGAGAPRFNVVTNPGAVFHFGGGCSAGVHTPAPHDTAQWTRVRLGIGDFFPALLAGDTIDSISIVYDEGTDTATNDTEGVGLSIIDNILINGTPTAPLIVKP